MAATRIGVTVSNAVNRVPTLRRPSRQGGAPAQFITQHHRGYRAYVWLTGERQPIAISAWHRKPGPARAEGMRMARAEAKARGLQPPTNPTRTP